MFKHSLLLFKPFGIEVQVHWSWLILAFLITSSLATGWFPTLAPQATTTSYWIAGTVGALGLFLSIVVHEFCHALVGRYYKMPVEKITLFLLGGVAHLEDEPPSPRAEFNMAIAGPLASVVLAFVFYWLFQTSTQLEMPILTQATFSYLASINVVVAVFNMLPGFPLDGGRCLRATLWAAKGDVVWATKISSFIGQGFGFLLMALGLASTLAGAGISGIWFLLIGFLLVAFARTAYAQILIKKTLHGKPAATLMNAKPVILSPAMPVSDFMRESINQSEQSLYPVLNESGDFLGCVEMKSVGQIPESEWPRHQIAELVKTCQPDMQISPETDAERALQQMTKAGYRELLVVKGNQVFGILSQSAIARYLSLSAVPQS